MWTLKYQNNENNNKSIAQIRVYFCWYTRSAVTCICLVFLQLKYLIGYYDIESDVNKIAAGFSIIVVFTMTKKNTVYLHPFSENIFVFVHNT